MKRREIVKSLMNKHQIKSFYALAIAMNESPQKVNKWFDPKRNDLPAEHLPAIASYFNVSTDYLFGITNEDSNTKEAS